MREILFRGKRLDNGEWVDGSLFILKQYQSDIDHYYILPTNTVCLFCDIFYYAVEVDPSTVGQYTGLTANGKKIFEGDILHRWSEYREEYVGICVVKYGEFNCGCCDGVYGWYLDGGDIRYFNSDSNDYEVCGNVYDHPKLLEDVIR